ncbi:MAG: ABC transporter permease [Candidatus Thermoplasmatota archaeon]|nr:ABC transporter permease [Candidatus Thermoplasmatota archaeon]
MENGTVDTAKDSKKGLLSNVTHEKIRLALKQGRKMIKQVLKNPMGLIGVCILVFFAFIAVFGPYLAPYTVNPEGVGQFDDLMPQSEEHIMGTDSFGFDIFSQLLYGARTSIIVGIFSAMIASILGAMIGLYSGYAGGWKDEVIMRLNDIVLSIPWLVLMIIIAAFLGEISLISIILIIGLTGWSGTARLVRSQVLSIKERQYIERARAIGSGDMHIIRRHILPNSFPLVFANTILTVAISILSEATLSFLGMRPIGVVTWGTMLSHAFSQGAFHIGLHYWIIMPGLCIVFVVLGFTLLGYALDEVMNPKLRKR